MKREPSMSSGPGRSAVTSVIATIMPSRIVTLRFSTIRGVRLSMSTMATFRMTEGLGERGKGEERRHQEAAQSMVHWQEV